MVPDNFNCVWTYVYGRILIQGLVSRVVGELLFDRGLFLAGGFDCRRKPAIQRADLFLFGLANNRRGRGGRERLGLERVDHRALGGDL